MKNQVYKFDEYHECRKQGTLAECQLACQQTAGCSRFSYFTPNFKNSKYVNVIAKYVAAKREAMDCCLVTDTVWTLMKMQNNVSGRTYIRMHNVISGPKFCVTEKTEITENNALDREKDIFSGKIVICKHLSLTLPTLGFLRVF